MLSSFGFRPNPFELTHEPESLQHTDIEGVLMSVSQVRTHGRVGFSELLYSEGWRGTKVRVCNLKERESLWVKVSELAGRGPQIA